MTCESGDVVRNVVFIEYGCVLCQCYHREGRDALYGPHLHRQGKHTYREVDVYEAILEAHERAK